jgi:spermidine/putrescine transport system permease protein
MANGKAFSVRRQTGFTAIAIVCFVLLYMPIVTLVIYSFNEGVAVGTWEGFSLQWYEKAMANELVQEAALRSFQVAAFAATFATALATMAAIATTRARAWRGQQGVYLFVNIPLMVPEIVTGIALLIVFSSVKVWSGYTGLGYILAAHTAFCVPFAYLPIRARLQSMDTTLELAASDLYATPWLAFRRITLPLLWPGILGGFMLAFVISLDDVVITELVKSAGQETLPTYMLGQLRRIVTPEMNAISTVFLGLSVLIVTSYFLLTRKRT